MDTDEGAPPVDPALFDHARETLEASGPLAAIDRLCSDLREAEDFHNLFYAMLMRKRVELNLPPFPNGPQSDIPAEHHAAYEDAIREAGRTVGNALIARGEIPKAWAYFRMLGEPEPVKAALAAYNPGPDDDTYPIVEVAWQHGLLPEKGFDLILDRHGVCSAITMVHSSDLNSNAPLKEYCTKRLVKALHDQLTDRLQTDLQARGIAVPAGSTVSQMIAGRDDLFADDLYHIDVSHLSSVVQLAMQLSPCPELNLARELCDYGAKLSPGLRGNNDPPFENTYADYKVYLDILAGENVAEGLAHFKAKLESAAEQGFTFPAEVAVNLLLKRDRLKDALAVAKKYLADAEGPLSCPTVTDLARQADDFATLAAVAESKSDPVNFLAGLIASRR